MLTINSAKIRLMTKSRPAVLLAVALWVLLLSVAHAQVGLWGSTRTGMSAAELRAVHPSIKDVPQAKDWAAGEARMIGDPLDVGGRPMTPLFVLQRGALQAVLLQSPETSAAHCLYVYEELKDGLTLKYGPPRKPTERAAPGSLVQSASWQHGQTTVQLILWADAKRGGNVTVRYDSSLDGLAGKL